MGRLCRVGGFTATAGVIVACGASLVSTAIDGNREEGENGIRFIEQITAGYDAQNPGIVVEQPEVLKNWQTAYELQIERAEIQKPYARKVFWGGVGVLSLGAVVYGVGFRREEREEREEREKKKLSEEILSLVGKNKNIRYQGNFLVQSFNIYDGY